MGLLGIYADPIQSREYVLLANILDASWREGRDLDLAALIAQIQKPPFIKVGVVDLDTFYPPKERFALGMSLNNLLAPPSFQPWPEGEPLDIGPLLFTPAAGREPALEESALTLLKQARAYGLGIVLATQNPVDLDYKRLSNAGTWFIRRLQTERDKLRVLDGLEGAAARRALSSIAVESKKYSPDWAAGRSF